MENIYLAKFSGASGTEYVVAVYADSEKNTEHYIATHYQIDGEIQVKQLNIQNGVQVLFEE